MTHDDCFRKCVHFAVSWACLIGCCGAWPASADEAGPPAAQTVFLHGGRDSALLYGGRIYQGLLGRELFRQALLLAAREELSCVTRDAHLGQEPPGAACTRLDLLLVAARPNRLELLSGDPPQQALRAQLPLETGEAVDLAALASTAEQLSRGDFVRQLRAAGVTGAPRRWSEDGPLSPELANLLAEMNFVSQWRAAQRLHAQVASAGQSPAALAGLSRAYANLGVLTELHWHATNKVFKARALLYAQRLAASGRAPAVAQETRAYALLLAGLPLPALAELDALTKSLAQSPADGRGCTPGLEQLLRAFATFQHDDLRPGKPPAALRELAVLLGYLAREYSRGADAHVAAARQAVQELPHCYRILEYLSIRPEVGLGHWATAYAPQLTAETLYPRLAAIPELPPAARKAVDEAVPAARQEPLEMGEELESSREFLRRAQVTQALAEFPLPAAAPELEWRSLARLLSDHSFGEALRRGSFIRYSLAAPVDEWLAECKPLFERHPFAMALHMQRYDPAARDLAAYQAVLADIDFLEMGAYQFIYVPTNVPNRQNNVRSLLERHMDHVATDQARMLTKYQHLESAAAAATFALWPASPAGRYGMLKWRLGELQQSQAQWQQWAQDDPELLAAIGGALYNQRKYREAAAVLEQACKQAPSFAAYDQLAFCYRELMQDDDWLRTVKAALQLEDRGLNHARLNSLLANFYRRQRDYRQALPFAEAAAESYSEWGLRLAAETNEAVGRFDRAEQHFANLSERYNTLDWYLFTRRTDHGDAARALAFTKELLTVTLGARAHPLLVAQFSILTGDHPRVVTALRPLLAQAPDELAVPALLMLSYEELKQFEQRDALLKRVLAAAKDRDRQVAGMTLFELLDLLHKDLAAGGKAEFDPAVLEAARKRVKDTDRGFVFDYVLGRYLERRGKIEQAQRVYLRAWQTEPNENLHRHLSGARLEQLGVRLSDYKTDFQKQLEAARKAEEAKKAAP